MRTHFLSMAVLLAAQLAANAQQVARPALVIRPPSTAERVAQADAIVLGKVESIEDKTVEATTVFGGEGKVEYHVAIVKVQDAYLNAKGLTDVKVAFQQAPQVRPGGIRPVRGVPPADLTKDQEVCLMLKSHPTESFFVLTNGFMVLDKAADQNWEKDVTDVKHMAKLLQDPDAALKGKDADDRYLTAAMLLVKYRTQIGGSQKTEEIPAAESKLILKALAEVDWTKNDPTLGINLQPSFVFGRLGLTEKDGWKQEVQPDPTKLDEARKQWLKEHADTYRIQRFVSEKKEEK